MSAKLVVLYGVPDDADAFDTHYRDVHRPLAESIPGLQQFEVAKAVGTPDGSPAPYHLIVELHFADPDAIGAAFGTDEGKAAAADYANIAPPGSLMFIAVSD